MQTAFSLMIVRCLGLYHHIHLPECIVCFSACRYTAVARQLLHAYDGYECKVSCIAKPLVSVHISKALALTLTVPANPVSAPSLPKYAGA